MRLLLWSFFYSPLVIGSGVITLAFLIMKFSDPAVRARNFAVRFRVAATIIVFGFLGCNTTGTLLNSFLDFSRPQTYDAKIIGRRIKKDRGNYYFIYVDDWKFPGKRLRLGVRGPIYNSHLQATKINVTTKRGLLGIEWIVAFGERDNN